MTTDEKINGAGDIADFDKVAEVEAVLEVRHPKTGEVLRHDDGRPFTITTLSRDSDAFRSTARRQADRRIAVAMRTRQAITTAVAEKDDIELLVAVTCRWDIILNGAVPPSTTDEFRKVYSNPKRAWLREQIDDHVGVRANFIQD